MEAVSVETREGIWAVDGGEDASLGKESTDVWDDLDRETSGMRRAGQRRERGAQGIEIDTAR